MTVRDDDNDISHEADLPRVNRISGQITGIKKMIEEQRHCPEILTQIRAVRSALKGLEANILERHLNHCVTESLKTQNHGQFQVKINELKDLFRRYDEQ